MESLVRYVWKHRLFPLGELKTTDGLPIEVMQPGMENRNDGPDFFNAKVKIGNTLWVGNVEIHRRSSDWRQHGHHTNVRYDCHTPLTCAYVCRDTAHKYTRPEQDFA